MSPKQIIFKLETKVEAAIDLIQQLKQRITQISLEKEQMQKKFQEYEETIQGQLDEYEERVLELEKLVDSAQKEQSNLEKSVVNAISNFETIEELQNGVDFTGTQTQPSATVDNSNNSSTKAKESHTPTDNTVPTSRSNTDTNTPTQSAEHTSTNSAVASGSSHDEGDTIFVSDDTMNDSLNSSMGDTSLDIGDSFHDEDNMFHNDNDINIDEIDFASDFDPLSDRKEEEHTKLEIL